ncbi:lanthionine synthetase C family protein [Allokutzneria multivorans]|uniref:Lanthionine synthetase C family protein n=1 Tax=Allokutzneria multivorans TaxID=1142134 RepID=A0ABP7SE71_9PSEU
MNSFASPGATPPRAEPTPGWNQCLAHGAAGLALLHIAHARTGRQNWSATHQWIIAMMRTPVSAHATTASLFQGAPAVAFVLRSAGNPEYELVLNQLEAHVAVLTRVRLRDALARMDSGTPPALREFDLINGLTGLGVALLGQRDREDELLRGLLRYLVRLASQPVFIDGQPRPGWWTAHAPTDRLSAQWPGGHANFSLAHGISGPLALLSFALRAEITVDGHHEAIETICAQQDQWRLDTDRPRWPGILVNTEWASKRVRRSGTERPSWCYGLPGIARARQAAGIALGDRRKQHEAEGALAACLRDERQLALVRENSLCHGRAGLVLAAWRAGTEATASAELTALARQLPHKPESELSHPADQDGLFNGTAGAELVRHTVSSALARQPMSAWDACLLLAPTTSIASPEGTE